MRIKTMKWSGILLSLAAPGVFLFSQVGGGTKVEDLLSLIKIRSGLEIKLPDESWTWNEKSIRGTSDSGEAVFSTQKWLMNLIHWGPIQTKEISVSYVRDRMQKMWSVNFEFTGTEGTMQIAEHPAVYVDAYGTNRAFFTRFVIWNCPESGREFIADLNYNLGLKTPREDFETAWRLARTIGCHPGAHKESFPDLTNRWESSKYGFLFDHPERWYFLDSPFYVPFTQYEGVRDGKFGSILGLCSDQNTEITLIWGPAVGSKDETSMLGADQEVRQQLRTSLASIQSLTSSQEEGSETFRIGNRVVTRLWGNCVFKEPIDERERRSFGPHGVFEAAKWEISEKGKGVTLILLTRESQYQNQFSNPSREALDRRFREFVLLCK